MRFARLASVLTLLLLQTAPALAGTDGPVRALSMTPKETQSAAYRAAAREKRGEAMAMLEQMLRTLPPQDPRHGELLFRLGELYAEEAQELRLDALGADEGPVDPALIAASERWCGRAITTLERLLEQHPDYARADEATWALAGALDELSRHDEALQRRLALVRAWPDSALAQQAYVLIGERYFDTGDVYRASLAYQRALTYKGDHWKAFTLYKLAWTQHNLGLEQERVETMLAAVVASTPAPDQSARGTIGLQEEAIKDLVGFLAETGDIDEARRVLTQIGRADLMPSMLARLGDKQAEFGRFEQAIVTWRRLLSEAPDAPTAPGVLARIAETQRKLGRPDLALATLEDSLKRYGPGSPWAAAQTPERAEATMEQIERELRGLAIAAHQQGKGSAPEAMKRSYALADHAYQLYLAHFAERPSGYEVRYAYAELLYATRRYDLAYAEYMAVVALDPKGRHAVFCAESAIFAAEKMVAAEPAPQRGLSAADEALIRAADQHLALFPGPKTKALTYKVAWLLYERQQLQDASVRFRQVIALDPAAPEAEQAANLILDAYVLVGDWERLVEDARAFRDQPGLGGAAFKQDVARVYENARLKQIETTVAAGGEHRRAADAFMAFYQEFPTSPNADLALNNAAARYAQARETASAMAARETLLDRFPGSRFYTENLAQLAYEVEGLADFPRAAALYEQLYRRDPGHPASREAIWSAALFRKVMGDWRASVANYERFVASFPADPRAPEARLALARVLDDNAQWSEAAAVYASFFQSPPSGATTDQVLFARVRYGQDLERLVAPRESQARHWAETLAFFQAEQARGASMVVGPDLAAEVLVRQLQPTLDRYAAMEITNGKGASRDQGEALRRAFTAKLDALQAVERGLEAVIATGSGEWGLRALVELGGAYEDMASALRTSPVPAGLSAEQLSLYQDGIEQRAYAMEQKAIQAYDLCLARSFELELYNETATASLARLRALDPDAHAPLEERVMTASYVAGGAQRRPFVEEP